MSPLWFWKAFNRDKFIWLKRVSKVNHYLKQNKIIIQLKDHRNERSKLCQFFFVCNTTAFWGWWRSWYFTWVCSEARCVVDHRIDSHVDTVRRLDADILIGLIPLHNDRKAQLKVQSATAYLFAESNNENAPLFDENSFPLTNEMKAQLKVLCIPIWWEFIYFHKREEGSIEGSLLSFFMRIHSLSQTRGRFNWRFSASLFNAKSFLFTNDRKPQMKVQSATASLVDENSDVHFYSKFKRNVNYYVTAARPYPVLRLDKHYAVLIRCLGLWTVTKQFLFFFV